jgi:hypothetical protein
MRTPILRIPDSESTFSLMQNRFPYQLGTKLGTDTKNFFVPVTQQDGQAVVLGRLFLL